MASVQRFLPGGLDKVREMSHEDLVQACAQLVEMVAILEDRCKRQAAVVQKIQTLMDDNAALLCA